MKKTLVLALAAAALLAATPTQTVVGKLAWRNIGPFLGGRVVAVAGVPSRPNLFYFGGVQSGVWRSTNYGNSWTNISDGKIPGTADSIGALAVAPSNPQVIYAGSGEKDIRADFDTGEGIYKTADAGTTWQYAGLRDTHVISGLSIDPANPNIVYAASMGHVFAANAERGVFKTTDGGKNWTKILYVDDKTGAIDLEMDPSNPRVLYAAMWQAQRVPWKLTSGGPGSGLYKTTDGGAHWTNLSRTPGFAHGVLGRIGIGIAASNPRIVYATVQAHDGGIFRSNDGGATWKRVNSQMKLRQRAFYYSALFVDPTNPNIVYAPEVDDVFKTTDGGVTWKNFFPPYLHGDHHILWINPHDTKIILEGDDGGATVTTDGGKTWSSEVNQPTGQFYHIALDDQFPYHVYGAMQDEGAFAGPSATAHGNIQWGDWQTVADGESTFVAPEPGDPSVTYGSGYYSSMFRLDSASNFMLSVSPWPTYLSGASAGEQRYRFGWTHPILFSPANPHELLIGGNRVFSSLDSGQTWKIISPDLTRDDKTSEAPSGGPIDLDQTGAETFPDLASLAASPLNGDVIYAGSADGLVHVTKDHGATWSLVTPPQLPQWAQISSIEPSHAAPGTAYLSASRFMWDDFHPYVYMTTDYGAHWTSLTSGLPSDQYVFVVREDPREPKLLFAGTRSTVYASFDGGAHWQPLTLNLPGVQVRDIAMSARQGQVAIATHGRAFWVLDNLALLEQLAKTGTPDLAQAQLFAPETAWLTAAYGSFAMPQAGQNPSYGATVFFNVPAQYDGKTPLTLAFEDARGTTIRRFTLHLKDAHAPKVPPEVRYEMSDMQQRTLDLAATTTVTPGMNRFVWDMRYEPASEIIGYKGPTADDFSAAIDGPTIVPGTYTVVLRYGNTERRQPLVMQLDPRLHATPDDLAARLALEMKVRQTLETLDTTINAAMLAEHTLPPAKRTQVERAIADVVQFDIHSSEGDFLHETKVRSHLGFLANQLELGYARPTAADYASYDDLAAQASAGVAALQALIAP